MPRPLLVSIFAWLLPVLAAATPPAIDTARMDQVARFYVDAHQFMGVVLVAHGDEVIFSKAYGSANLEWDVPNTPDTKFRLGSLTKQFTAAAVLLLEERGKVKLDDPIKTYYPDAPPAWDAITLRHLLGHTSGIPNYTATPDFGRMSATHSTPADLVQRVANLPLEFQPGAQMRYSNTGYVLLGMVIEKASGGGYAAFLKQNLFDPLGMKDTGYDVNALVLPKRASGYTPGPNGIANAIYVDMTTPFSAGGLYSTAADLLRWERALFGGKVVSPASFEKMTTQGKGNYGMGLFIEVDAGHRVIGHGGGIPGFNSRLAHFPDSDITVVALSNLNGPGSDAIAQKLGLLAQGDKVVLMPERKSIQVPVAVLQKYVGEYDFDGTRVLKVTLEDGQLYCQVTGDGKFPIAPETPTRFFPLPFEAQFEFKTDKKGNVTGMLSHQGSEEKFVRRLASK